jgi:hypothetical protein
MNLTHDQIKRAAQLLESLAKQDKDIDALKRASKVSAYARDTGSNILAQFERSRSEKHPFDDHAETLHRFLLKLLISSREKVARELRQLDVSAPDLAT